MMIAILFLCFAACLVIGVPLAFAMGISAIAAIAFGSGQSLLVVPQRMNASLDSFALLAVPLFILAGELMNSGGITERIVRFSRSAMGHFKGGLAQANILSNMFMAALSGSSLADLSAIGSMMIPAMKREGYSPAFCVAVTACAAMVAPIIPPSVIAVIYGSVTGVSIGALFLGGAIPGIVAGVALMAITWFLAPRAGGRPQPRTPVPEALRTTVRAVPAMVMPFLIIGGILSGAFTPTEAGAVAALYALLFGLLMRRHTAASLYRNLSSAVVTTAAALVTIAGAALFGWILARDGVGIAALQLLLGVTQDPTMAMLIVIVFFFLLGTFLEPVPALIITAPVMGPIIAHLGFDPVHFGIVVIMMLVVGSVTPPVGILAMVACKIAGVEFRKTFLMLLPYTLAWIGVVILVAFNPWMVTWLPSLLT